MFASNGRMSYKTYRSINLLEDPLIKYFYLASQLEDFSER